MAKEARAIGNLSMAQRASRDVAMLSAVVARLEKGAREEKDTLRFSKAQIEEGMAQSRERFQKLLDRPLLCAACGAKLSVHWAHGSEVAP